MTRALIRRASLGLVLALAALASGCAPQIVSKAQPGLVFPAQPRLAIMPFDNYSGKEQASGKVTEYFQTLLTNTQHFKLVEFGDTYEAMRKHRIRSASLMTSDQIDSLAKELDVDYIVTGSVIEYNEVSNNYLGKIPQISFNTRLIDCRTRRTVWTSVINDSGDRKEFLFGIGAVKSADELARQMVQESVDKMMAVFTARQ